MVTFLRWDVAREVVRSEGVIGLSRGLGLTVLREVPAFGAYFFAYETFYKYGNVYAPDWPALVTMVKSRLLIKKAQPVGIFQFAGGMAGVNCWIFSYPTDVIKTRMQADGIDGVNRYRNARHCFQLTKAEAGTIFNPRSAFWVGFAPTALRAFPGKTLRTRFMNYVSN